MRGLQVRRQYVRLALRAAREGRLAWLAGAGVRTLAVPISARLGRALAGPVLGNLALTYRCNNKCFMCDLPKRWLWGPRGVKELDTAALSRIIDDFAAIGTVGLGFTGGEPTLRPDCEALLTHAVGTGMLVHLNTNAYRLHEPDRVDRLLATGLDSMNVSLDGADAETHDTLRGAPGGFERVARATELILARRRDTRPSLTYTFVLGPRNAHQVGPFVELARRRGVTSVSFMPLAAVYRGAEAFHRDALRRMDEAVAWLRDQKARSDGDFFDNSDEYLGLFPKAFRSQPSPLRCYASYNHLLVDCFGNVFPCVLMYERGTVSGNVTETPLTELWRSKRYEEARRALSGCTECFWNCHTELNLLYQRAGAPRNGVATAGAPPSV